MTWQTNGINGSTFETLEPRMLLTGAFPSAAENAIVYDAKGNLDVAYYDSTAHNLKYTQQSPNGAWSTPTVIDGSSRDVGKYVTIAIGTGGYPAVAYQDTANADLKFAQYNGSSWSIVFVDKRKTTGFNPSLVFDAQGNALISYYKQNTGDLLLATVKGKKAAITPLQTTGNVGQFSSIAINPSTGKPAIAFSNGTGAVQYIAKSGTTFSKPVTVAKTTGSSDVSLAFGSTGANVGYVNPATGTVNLGQLTGKTFTTTAVGTVTLGTTTAPQVLIDPTTHAPAVIYSDTTGVFVATTTTTNGSSSFQTMQVQNGGTNTVAIIQPGSGSIVFSTVDNTGGTLTINTTTAAPNAPSMVTATAVSPSSASISWVDNSTNEAGFLVERSTDNVAFTTVATTQPNITSFTDTLLNEATLYYYRVSAIGAAGNNSGGTTGPGGTQLVPAAGIATTTTLPAAPSAVVATPVSPTTINVSWSNNSNNPGGFTINRSTDGGDTFTSAGSVGGNVTTFSDSGLTEGTAYTYEVIAFNGSGGSTSPIATTHTLPAAPSGLTTSVTSTSALTLSWQNNSAAAAGFIVQRSTDGTHFTTIGNTNGTTTSYGDTGLSEAGSYYYQVITVGPGTLDSAASAPTNATTNPTAPSNLAATAVSSNRINLTWTDNSTGATNVIVQRSNNGGAFATIATLGGTANSYADINRTEGVNYTYRIQSITGASASGFSATVTTVTLPAAPTALTATAGATVSGPNVTLSWTDNSTSETGFVVQRSTDNGTTWTTLPAAPANSSATGTYVDSTAGEGKTYSYRVAAVNASGQSASSNTPSVTIVPAAPSGLTATAASGTEIDLAWTNNSLGQTGTFVERSTDGTTWVPVSANPVSGSAYSDTGLTPGVTYNYRISAINAGGASGFATAIGVTAPATPTNITATPVSNTEIDITWTPVSGATSYLVRRSLDGVTFTSLPTVTTSTLADLNRTEGTEYQYTVTAINAGGSSVAGGPVSITTTPAAPSGVTASGVTATSVRVTWTNNSIGAAGFIVQRSSDGTNWMQIGAQVTQTSITDSTAAEATTYTYRVEAVNAGGSSAFVAGNTIQTVPLAPTNVTATVTSSTSVHLTWTDNSLNAAGYTVQRSIDNENFTTIGSGNGSLTSFDDTHATAATQYWYRVFATNSASGTSDYSNSAQATTTPAAPQNVVATTVSSTAVGITWNAVAGATSYNILRSTDNVSFSGLLPSSTNSYTDSTATEGTQYYYTIEAVNGSGHSADSTSATATTKPSAPTSLTVTATTAGSATLSWTNTSHAATNFKIERSDDNGTSYSQINTAAGTATSFTDSTVSEGAHFIYRIRATGAGGDSAYSNSTGADTLPAAPTGLTVSANSATSVTVSWTNVSTHATNYVVSRSDDGGTSFNVVQTLGSSAHTYTDTVPEGGSYQYRVRATQTLVDGVTVLRSTWTPTQSLSAAPAAPSNVAATVISASEVDVTWTNNSAHQTGFKVYSSTDGIVYNLLGTALSTATSYMDFTATAGTQYYYRVRATGTGGDSAPADSSPLTSIPAIPTPVSTSTAANPSVVFSWSDVAGETGFDVQRSTDGGHTWSALGSTLQGVTQITDHTSVEDGMYQYRVRATNASGNSAYSSALSASTFLGAPSGLTTTSVTGTHVSLSWTDHSSAAMGYEVQRSSDNGTNWTSLTSSLSSTATSYTDSTVADGTPYSYRVRGLNTAGNSDFTSTVNATTTVLAPTNLITTAVSTTQVNLSWTNASSTASSFQIWRSTDGGTTFTQLDAVSGQTTYSDHALTAGQTVMYEVFAGNVTGQSPASSAASGSSLPAAPSSLDVEPVSTTSLSLSWHANSPGATGYAIYRDSGNGFNFVTTTSGSGTTYTDTGLTEGSTYSYKIFAVNAGGSSGPSNVASNDTICAGPTNLAVTATSATSINLSWTSNTHGASGYAVLYSTDNGESFDIFDATLDPGATAYSVGGLTEATSYQFQVYGYNGVGPSAVSNTVTQVTTPLAPTLSSVSAQADGNHVTWSDNSAHSTGFLVERSSNGGATYPQSFTVSAGQSSYVDNTGSPNTSYTYRVRATDAGGNSAPSSTGTALTAPAAPTNLAASSTTSTSAHLTWTPDSHGAGGYNIQRSTDGTNYTSNGTALGSASSYTDNTAVAGTIYKYLIIATNTTGSSAAAVSNFVTIRTGAPTGVATTSVSATSVSLTWNDVQGESGFTVQRSDDNSNWTTLGSTLSGVKTYTDNTAAEGNTYYYRVAGTNSSGTGDYSAGLPVLTLPAAASHVIATPISTTEVDLTWTDNAHAAAGYDVYRSANGGNPVLLVHGLGGTATSYPDSSASAGTSYSYQVFAFNATGSSTAATATALTIPGQPQNLTAVAPSASEIDLTWSSVASATSYSIARSPNGTDHWTTLGSASSGAYQDTGLSEGTRYYYSVTAANATGAGQAATTNAPTLPAPVTSLHATSPSATEVDLTWTDTSVGATGYNLYRSTDSGHSFTTLTSLSDPAANSYTDTTTEGTSYVYRIRPIDASGEGDATDISITTQPASPTLTAATPVSASEVDLTWTNNSAHVTTFTVKRTPFGANTWTTLTSTLSSSTTTYHDQSAAAGTNYQYQVLANLTGANSGPSNVVAALTNPAAVTTLGTQSISTHEIDLSWTLVTGATSYNILRSTDNTTFTQIDSVGSGTMTYQDTNLGSNLTEGTRYYYQVIAHNSTGNSAAGNTSYTSTLATPPSGLTLSVVSNNEIDLTWTNNSTHGPSVGIERSTTGSSPWTQLTTVNSPGASYHDTGVSGGTTYYYRISAIDEGGTNYMTDVASVSALTAPNAPTITATPVIDGTVSLSWTTPATATTFTVEDSTDGVHWNAVATATSSTTAIDSALTGNTTYQYRVRATNASGTGPNSTIATALTVPDAPSSLSGTAISPTAINLSWSGDVASNVTYSVYRSPGTGPVHYVKIGTASNAVAYSDTGLTAGTSYLYEVVAANASGSNVTPALTGATYTTPVAPANLAKTIVSDTEVDLTWTASSGATSYTVGRSTDGVNFTTLTTLGVASSYNDAAASGGTNYTYKVTAINSGGGQSSTITALTYPTAPTGLTRTVVDNHDINVSWNASTGATSYTLQRSSDGTTWSTIASTGTSAADVVAGGGTYTYRVKASDATGDSTWATSSSVTVVPDAPTGVGATATSDTAVHVTWSLTAGATHYLVQRSDNNGNSWSDASSLLGSSAASFDDTGLTELTPYRYQVIASNGGGNSAASSSASVVTKPTAPSGLTTTSITSIEVDLSWTDNSNGLTAFDVERSDNAGSSWQLLGSTATGTATYNDTTVSPGSSYLYRVSADNGSVVSVTTAPLSVLTLPAAPTVSATPINAGEVDLSWNAVTSASSYTIFRKIGAGSFTSLTTGVTATSYHDTSVTGGTQYTYEVFAVNGTGTGPAGTSSAVLTLPAAQSDFAATPFSATQVNLTWSDVTGAASYTIGRKLGSNPYQILTSTLTSTDTSYSDTTAQAGTTYTYEIFATDATGDSTATTRTALTIPAVPTHIVATAHSATDVTLAWDAMTGATSYTLTYSTDGGTTYSSLAGSVGTNSYDFTTATPATDYLFQIVANNATGSTAAGTSNGVTTVPATPTAFTATGVSASEIDLAWTDVARATHYEVDRLEVDGVTWDTLSTTINPGDQAYADTGLTAGTTYTYRIEALDAGGSSVPTSSRSAVTTPATPTNIVATTHSATDVTLAWDAMPGAATYTLTYSTDGGSTYSALASSVGTNSYDFSTATAATHYLFQVVAVNATGSSSAGTSNAVTTVPATPTGFTAHGVSTTEIDLAWTDVPRATHYEVDRLEQDGVTWDTLTTTVDPGDEAFNDTGLTGGTHYTYRIEALDAGGASTPTAPQSALTAPPAPTNVVATANSDTDVTLTWHASTGATSYTLVYSNDGGTNYSVLDTGVSATTYDFSTATPATPYLFGIVAVNATGSSLGGLSNTITTVPETPTHFTATGISTTEIDLAWTDVTGADHYEVDRLEQDGVTWDTLTTSVNPGDQAYADTGLSGGTTYTYRVEALDAGGASAPTDTASALTAPAAPTHVVATPVNSTRVDLTWDAMTGAASYTITVSTDNGSTYNSLASNVHATTYMDLGATPGTSHLFKVVAVNATGSSAPSTSNAALTVPAAQTDFAATPVNASEVDLTWTDVTGATSYTIERDNGDGNLMILTTSLSSSDTSYHDTTAASGTNYTYEIFGNDATGSSAPTQGTALTVPASVTGITATPNGTTEIDLAWTADTGTVTGYQVLKSTDGGLTFSQVGSNLAANATSDHVTGLTAATSYQFEVVAINASGASYTASGFDGRYYANTATRPDLIGSAPTFEQVDPIINIGSDSYGNTAGTSSVPGAPGGFGNSTFVVEWDGKVRPLYSEQYTFYATSDDGIRLVIDGQLIGADNFNRSGPQHTYTDVVPYTFTAGHDYNVQVQFRQRGGGYDARFEWASASQAREFVRPSQAVGATTVPTTPTGFSATGISASEVDLAWTDVTGATAYEVDRLEQDGVTWDTLTTSVAPGDQAYVDHSTDGGTSYTYRVEALDAGGASAPTATQAALTAPPAPAHILATPISATEVDLTWDATTGADSYTVTVSTDGGSTYSSLTSGLHTTSYHDTSATPGTSNLYQIFATNVTANGDPGTSNGALTVPAAQTDFAATPFNATQVNLTWSAVTGAASYTIERKTGSGDYAVVPSSLTGTDTSFQDTTAAAATAYTYEIFATDATGDSVATTHDALTVPGAVVISSATVVGTGEVDLAWAADSGVVSGYRVLRSDDNGMSFSQVGSDLSSSTLTLNDTGLAEASSHIYRVLALNATGHSGNSDSMVKTTLPSTPANFAVNAVSGSEIDLTWDAVSRATGYEVDRLNVDGHTWDALTPDGGTGTNSFNDTGLTPGTNYTYRIEALDSSGPSVSTTPLATITRPDVVADFTATVISGSEVDLSWDAAGSATGYRVMREALDSGTFTQLTTTTLTSLSDTGLTEASDYFYKIIAYNSSGNGAATSEHDLTTDLNTPALVITGQTNTSISLQWTNHSLVDTGYLIEQQTGPSTWTDVNDGAALTNDADTDTVTITGLTEATAYNFRVTALGNSGLVSVATPVSGNTAPNDPTSITATPSATPNVVLHWTNNSSHASSQLVERSTDGSHWSTVQSISGTATSYTDTTGVEATAYEYRVSAFKGTSQSGYATSSSVTTLPLAPTGLTSIAVAFNEIDLSWTDNSAGATAYRIYSSSDGITYSQLGSDLPSSAHSYPDSSAAENATTYYKIVAVDAGGESAGTALTNATTPLAAPTSVVAATTTDTTTGDKTINLSWTDVSSVATNVKVERSSDGETWTPLVTLAHDATSYSDDTAAENTTYTYRVYAVAGLVSSTHTAANDIKTLLSRPTGLTLSSPTPGSVVLTWNAVSSNATSYHVERSTDGVHFTDIHTINSASATTYTDSGRTEGTLYYYQVRAVSGSNTSNYSDVSSITTIPATPTSLTATPFSTTEIDLSWTDVSSTNTSYTVETSTDGGTTWTTAASGLGATAHSYSDTGLVEATDHEYRVFAIGAGGNSLDSNTSSTNTIPAAASGLTLASETATSVSLTWTDNSNGETNYEVWRATDGVHFTALTTALPANTTSYTDSTAAEGTTYQYEVRDNRNSVESAFTSQLAVTTLPAAPTGLNIVSFTSSRVTLGWTDISSGETGYKIARSTDGGTNWSVIATVGANSVAYSDNTVTEGLSYSYYVYAYNSAGSSTNSGTVTANIPPAAPSALTITSFAPNSVSLSWTNNSSHQTGFYIERSINQGGFSQIADVTSGTTYTDSTVSEATRYDYRVRAHGATGNSSYSSSVAQNKTPLIAPTSLTATTISTTEIDLTWADNSSQESKYSVERSTDGGMTWSVLSNTLAAGTTSYHNTGLTEGSTYTYRVQALRTSANSAYTSSVAGTTLPAAPSGVTATATSESTVTVTWTDNSVGATGFTIERSLNGSTWGPAGTVGAGVTTFHDTGLTELTAYYYRVKATNAGGSSTFASTGSGVSTLPAAPSGLAVSAPTNDSVHLTWTDNSSGATGYKVERNDGGGWVQLGGTLASNATSYTDLSIVEATAYSYRVRAVAGSVNSAYSNTQSITTVPADPDGIAATTISTTEIDITWNNNSAGATAYLVERSLDGGDTWTQIASLSGTATSYHNTGLVEGTDYQYRVRAQDAGGFSFYTDSADASTLPAAPSNFAASPASGHIDLTWTDNSSGESSYTVKRNNGGTWTTIASLGPDETSFSDDGSTGGLVSGNTYQYRVFCTGAGGDSAFASTSGTAV